MFFRIGIEHVFFTQFAYVPRCKLLGGLKYVNVFLLSLGYETRNHYFHDRWALSSNAERFVGIGAASKGNCDISSSTALFAHCVVPTSLHKFAQSCPNLATNVARLFRTSLCIHVEVRVCPYELA